MANSVTYRRWLVIVFAILVTTTIALALATLFAARIVRDPDYAAKIQDPSMVAQDRAFTMHGQRCDVLIDGDSTASIGIDPRVITQQTGLSACNIASTRPVWEGAGTLPLDTFLQNNPKPKILLLAFSPEFFYRATKWEDIQPFAPYVLMLRHGSRAMALHILLLHPAQTMQFLQTVLKFKLLPRTGSDLAHSNAVFDRTVASLNESGGRLNLELPPLAACGFLPEKLNGRLDTAWIAAIRARYQAMGIVTLIDASPLPVCEPQGDLFQREVKPYLDAYPAALPIGMFVAGGRHATAEGAAVQSEALAWQIKAALQSHIQ